MEWGGSRACIDFKRSPKCKAPKETSQTLVKSSPLSGGLPPLLPRGSALPCLGEWESCQQVARPLLKALFLLQPLMLPPPKHTGPVDLHSWERVGSGPNNEQAEVFYVTPKREVPIRRTCVYNYKKERPPFKYKPFYLITPSKVGECIRFSLL